MTYTQAMEICERLAKGDVPETTSWTDVYKAVDLLVRATKLAVNTGNQIQRMTS